jgi:large subunit ribosomal protein L3
MLKLLVGTKKGMTQIFKDTLAVPVTLIEIIPNTILKATKNENTDTTCVILAYGKEKKENKIKKPILGQIKKAKTLQPKIKEFQVNLAQDVELKIGDKVAVDNFAKGDKVAVSGITIGRGFQGVIKRHGFSRGPESHGSHHHRRPGSIGMCSFPARVLKGKKMPGRMGARQVTIKNLEVVKIEADHNLLYLKGAVPGANGNFIVVKG